MINAVILMEFDMSVYKNISRWFANLSKTPLMRDLEAEFYAFFEAFKPVMPLFLQAHADALAKFKKD